MSKAGQRCSKKHLSWSFLWNFHKKYSDFGKVTWLQNFLQNIYCMFWISQLCTVYKLKIFSKKYTGEIKKYRIYEFISINTGVMLVFGANIKNRLARLQWIKCFFFSTFLFRLWWNQSYGKSFNWLTLSCGFISFYFILSY